MSPSLQDPTDVQIGPDPLRILIIGWLIGRGSTGVYGEQLAGYLSRAGHSVTCLSAGACDWRLRPYLATSRTTPYEVVELRNPPIMGATRPVSPEHEIESPETERFLNDVLTRIKPHVVLILDFPGWPAQTVDVCRTAGSKVVVFLHNFWPFCTRLTLLDRWGEVCRDYANGERCVECTRNVLSTNAARWRARLPSALWRSATLYAALNRLYKASANARSVLASPRGSSYASRRAAYAKAIGSADLLLGISHRTIEVATQLGAANPNTSVVPIVLSHMQSIRRARPPMAQEPRPPHRPVRFAYLGVHAPEKGIGLLVAAFRGVRKGSAELHCFGGGPPSYIRELANQSDPANPPTFHGPYQQSELPNLLRDLDVGIVPSMCEDTRPNTVLEFQAAGIPVLGSRIGGIPEQIRDGRDGLLFEPGDAGAIRHALDFVIRAPDLIETWRANLPSDFDPHHSWQELEQAFRRLAANAAACQLRAQIGSV